MKKKKKKKKKEKIFCKDGDDENGRKRRKRRRKKRWEEWWRCASFRNLMMCFLLFFNFQNLLIKLVFCSFFFQFTVSSLSLSLSSLSLFP